ncbi:MAG: aminoglycoside phosphotransferase family protein [Burkholderiaceae bacterium]
MSSLPSSTPDTAAPDLRRAALLQWLGTLSPDYEVRPETLRPASADASFRRYFRVDAGDASLIAMDAPPDKEDSRPFIHVAGLLSDAGLNAPKVLEANLAKGFLLLTDLGTTTYLSALNDDSASGLFDDAMEALVRWQLASRPGVLPPYDGALLRRELNLFPDWYVARHLSHSLGDQQSQVLQHMFDRIIESNLAQPTVYVHRDYMPRNLMVASPNPGVLDFQDAVMGPITYDVASLFRDAFISWEEARVVDWVVRYWQKARRAGLPVASDFGTFWRDVEWMGLQRHLKVLGIFARINYRDGKPHYLADTPRFVGYVRSVTRRYDDLAPLARLFDELEGVAQRLGYTF